MYKPKAMKLRYWATFTGYIHTCCSCTWTHMVWKTGQVKFLVLRQDRMLMGTAGRRGNSLTLNQSAIKLGSFRCSWGKVGGSSLKICRNSEATSLKFYNRRKYYYLQTQKWDKHTRSPHYLYDVSSQWQVFLVLFFNGELTALASSLTSEFRRPVSSWTSLMMVSSVICRSVRAAQWRTFATLATASVSCRQQIKRHCMLQKTKVFLIWINKSTKSHPTRSLVKRDATDVLDFRSFVFLIRVHTMFKIAVKKIYCTPIIFICHYKQA